MTSSRASAIHIARVARTRVGDSGSEGPSTRFVLTETSTIVDRVVKPGSWVSEGSEFVVAPSELMWVSGISGGSGCTDLRLAGVGDWQALDA